MGTHAGSPIALNLTMTNADTEVSQVIPDETRILTMKLRSGSAELKISFEQGQSGTTYITVPRGSSFHMEGVFLSKITVYVQSPTATQVLEILAIV